MQPVVLLVLVVTLFGCPVALPADTGEETSALVVNQLALLELLSQRNISPLKVQHWNNPCPTPFVPVMFQCYYVNIHHKLQWEDARQFCHGMGGELAQPNHVNALIVHLLDNYPSITSFLLGGSNQTPDGQWRWINGKNIKAVDWMPGEPSSSTKSCLDFCFKNCRVPFPSLNDVPCSLRLHFVCEYPLSEM